MGSETKRVFDTGLIEFSFTDGDGVEFAHFHMDPGSPTLADRARRAAEFFSGEGAGANVSAPFEVETDGDMSNKTTVYDIRPPKKQLPKMREMTGAELDMRIAAEICALIGYDASEELFSVVRPTSVSADGEIFAAAILEAIAEAVAPELRRRREKLEESVSKYAAKYESGKE